MSQDTMSSQCLAVFLTKEKRNDLGQHFCAAFGTLQIELPRQTEDRSPFALATLTCAECTGTILQKPVFENNESLRKHYVLGHKAFALKELYGKEFLVCPFPAMCQEHHEWKICRKKLAGWGHMVLHFGITHQILFYLMVQDRYNNYYDVSW